MLLREHSDHSLGLGTLKINAIGTRTEPKVSHCWTG